MAGFWHVNSIWLLSKEISVYVNQQTYSDFYIGHAYRNVIIGLGLFGKFYSHIMHMLHLYYNKWTYVCIFFCALFHTWLFKTFIQQAPQYMQFSWTCFHMWISCGQSCRKAQVFPKKASNGFISFWNNESEYLQSLGEKRTAVPNSNGICSGF